jgi:hypothetical protein
VPSPGPRGCSDGPRARVGTQQPGLGLVSVASPERFNWPGYWIALLGKQDGRSYDGLQGQAAVLIFGTPSGVVLSPQSAGLHWQQLR